MENNKKETPVNCKKNVLIMAFIWIGKTHLFTYAVYLKLLKAFT